MAGSIDSFNTLLTSLLDREHYPDGYSRETLTGFRDQLAHAKGPLSPELEAHLEELASGLAETGTEFAEQARAALDSLRESALAPAPTAQTATRGISGLFRPAPRGGRNAGANHETVVDAGGDCGQETETGSTRTW